MDLHVYRNSQDRWHDLRATARERGAVLAVNAITFNELLERITPDAKSATPGQRLALLQTAPVFRTASSIPEAKLPNLLRYAFDAISELKAARIRPADLRAAGADFLADLLEHYDGALRQAGLCDPQERFALGAARVREGAVAWLERFQRIVLHALYDLSESQFVLIRSLIETLPEGGTVILFNTTANVKPTEFAEWTWQRFVQDEALADRTFPEFCRSSNPSRAVLEKLFVFEEHEPLPPDDSLRIVEAPSRYKEVERIAGDIAELLASRESPADVLVAVRHIEIYGEMLEDVFVRYGIPYRFETSVPLLRNPFIKYWLSLLDLVTSDRSREAVARVMSSAYFSPRLSPAMDVERILATCGYIDRRHLRASALAARKNSPLTTEIQRVENLLDDLEKSENTAAGFLSRLQPGGALSERDRQAWRVLSEELVSWGALSDRRRDARMRFVEFRKMASEFAGLLTVDRPAASATAPGVPRVRVVHPHSLGSSSHKWIFAPGFSDGEFPARSASNPLLSDRAVDDINARIRPRRLLRVRDRNRLEPLYLFTILDSATHRVTLSYPSSTLEGDPIYPSVYVTEIVRHYAGTPVARAAAGVPRSDGEWRSRVADEWRRGSLAENRAMDLLGCDIMARARLESKGAERGRFGRDILPLDGVWHPSELNSLSSCPFVFLARHKLRLRPSETPDFEVSSLEIGIFAHAILRDFYAQPVPSSVEAARIRMNDIISRRLSAADIDGQGSYAVFDPSLWKIRRRQLVSVLNRYVEFAVRDALDGFETKPEYLDAPLPAAAMGSALLAGRPDHVAARRSGNRIDAIRIDDFKYSAASSATTKQLKQSFQIPVYAYLAAQSLGADESTRIEGRYLLLRSPGNPVVSHPIDGGVFDEVRERIEGLLGKVRDGRIEPDPADRQGCAECGYRRLCRLYGG